MKDPGLKEQLVRMLQGWDELAALTCRKEASRASVAGVQGGEVGWLGDRRLLKFWRVPGVLHNTWST